MNSKFVILLLAVYLTNQVTANSTSKLTGAYDEIIEIASKILLFVNQLIDEAVRDISQLITEDLDLLDELRVKGVNYTEHMIQQQLQFVNQLIDSAKDRATESGLDILECIEIVDTKAAEIATQTLNLSLSCVEDSVQKTSVVLLQILDDVNKINADFKSVEIKLEECEQKPLPLICVKNVISELGEIAATVPAKAREEGQKAEKAVRDLVLGLEKCGKDAANMAQEANIAAFNDFSQCVWDKEHNNTLTK